MMTTAAIALGGNIGDVPKTFVQALAALDRLPEIQMIGRSRNFRTEPMGDAAGTAFINAVALLQTTFGPEKLLEELHCAEDCSGRTRETRWGPRKLDLDLLSFGCHVLLGAAAQESSNPPVIPIVEHRPGADYRGTLIVPHAACWYRRFVLDPWCDVAPHWKHPVLGETVEEMHGKLLRRPLIVQIIGGSAEIVDAIRDLISEASLKVELIISESLISDAAIRLCFERTAMETKGSVHAQRIVELEQSPVGVRMALAVMQAALDHPIPCPG